MRVLFDVYEHNIHSSLVKIHLAIGFSYAYRSFLQEVRGRPWRPFAFIGEITGGRDREWISSFLFDLSFNREPLLGYAHWTVDSYVGCC